MAGPLRQRRPGALPKNEQTRPLPAPHRSGGGGAIVSMRRAHPGWVPAHLEQGCRSTVCPPARRSTGAWCARLTESKPRRRTAKDSRRWELPPDGAVADGKSWEASPWPTGLPFFRSSQRSMTTPGSASSPDLWCGSPPLSRVRRAAHLPQPASSSPRAGAVGTCRVRAAETDRRA